MNLKVCAIKSSSKCSIKHKNPLGGRVWKSLCGCQDAAKFFNYKIGRDVLNFPSLCFFMQRWEAAETDGGKALYFFSASRIKEKYFKGCIPQKPGHLRKYLVSFCLLMLFSHSFFFRGGSETTDSASAAWLLFERQVKSLIRRISTVSTCCSSAQLGKARGVQSAGGWAPLWATMWSVLMRRKRGCKADVLDLLFISHASSCSSVVMETALPLCSALLPLWSPRHCKEKTQRRIQTMHY